MDNNFEKMGGSGEGAGEDLRGVYGKRGEKVLSMMEDLEKRRRELEEQERARVERLAQIEKEKQEIAERRAQIERELAGGVSSDTTGGEASTVVEGEAVVESGAINETTETQEGTQFDVDRAVEEAMQEAPEVVDDSRYDNIAESLDISAETVTTEVAQTIERAKKGSGLKKFLIGAAAVSAAAIMAMIGIGISKSNKTVDNRAAVESMIDNKETMSGIRDGYGERGMFLSETKAGPYNFANAKEVAEVCNNDEVEMMKYAGRNQSESLADYLANLPEQLQPEGFKGLGIVDAEKKLESLSDSEYDAVLRQYEETMDKAFTRRTVLDGTYDNAYMRKIDANGAATHGNMELVKWTGDESNLKVSDFYWLDENGNEIGHMMVKIAYGENGDIAGGCMQVVTPHGSKVYEGMPDITPSTSTTGTTTPVTPSVPDAPNVPATPDIPDTPVTPDVPDTPVTPDIPVTPDVPDPEPTPTPTPTPPEEEPQAKNQQEADENSGATEGLVTPEGQERQLTEEPTVDEVHLYNSETNTYDYTPAEQAAAIGYEVANDINEIRQETTTITAPEEIVTAEEMVMNQIAPEMVVGTREGVDMTNNFDAGATVGTGEVTGDTLSADGSGNTIQENLDSATGNREANLTGDYSQGF